MGKPTWKIENRESSKYWTVRLEVYAFETKAEAVAYQGALMDAFCAMPESAEYGSSSRIIEEDENDVGTE